MLPGLAGEEGQDDLAAWMQAYRWEGRQVSKLHTEHTFVLCRPIPFAMLSHLGRASLNPPAQPHGALGNLEGGLGSAIERSVRWRACPWDRHGNNKEDPTW